MLHVICDAISRDILRNNNIELNLLEEKAIEENKEVLALLI